MKQIVRIHPCKPSGSLSVPPSKSLSHRALICGALSQIPCKITPLDWSQDIEATFNALKSLGFALNKIGNEVYSQGMNAYQKPLNNVVIDCGESGSLLRFLLPLCAALGVHATFTGRGKLGSRPLGILTDCLSGAGIEVQGENLPVTLSGQLQSGKFSLRGDVSSQYITGLLLALPLLEGQSCICLTTPLESSGYVDMTLQTQAACGVIINSTSDGWQIEGQQNYKASLLTVEGDWSQAAFFGIMGAISGHIEIDNLNIDSAQGDRELANILRRFGATVETYNKFKVSACELKGIEIDAGQIPDLVPALAVLGAFAEGQTRIYNAGRLRLKESDRITAICEGINSLGGSAQELPEEIIIKGTGLSGGHANGYSDHRIVMALAAGGCFASNICEVTDAESTAKSYPAFFEDFKKVGGMADVIELV